MRLLPKDRQQHVQKTPTDAATTRNARYLLGCAILLLLGMLVIMEEKTFVMPVMQSLRGSETDSSTVLLEIALQDASSMANESLIELQQADERIIELKNEIEESRQQINEAAENANKSLIQLHEAEERIFELKQSETNYSVTISNLENELKEFRQQVEDLGGNSQSSNQFSLSFDSNSVCSIFPRGEASSATRLWQEHLPEIFEAAKNPHVPQVDNEDEHAKLWKILFETLSPARMRRAIRHLPTFSHPILKHVMGIIEKRISDPNNNPPLRIAVFGGSVTIGRDCIPGKMSYPNCAWPKRFELLVNQYFGQDIIKIYNLAVGGTSTTVSTNRVKYWMYTPEDNLSNIGPDVIINSYSTNDSLPPWDKHWPEDDTITILRERIRDQLQYFVREALQSRTCSVPPLVVHVDDYLGPQHPALLGELSYVSSMTEIAKYYDTVGISYGEVVRDIVYQDQDDKTFADKKSVHYGHLAHTTIALSVGFSALELLTNYCDDEYNALSASALAAAGEDGDTLVVNNIEGEPENTEGDLPMTKEKMRKEKLFLPPPLTREFLYQNATAEFDAAIESSHRIHLENDCDAAADKSSDLLDKSPCAEAWISTPGSYDSKKIENFMNQHKTNIDGWQAERQTKEGWSNKDGWIATKPNATFTLRFPSVEKEIKTVSIYFLRSYGEKWKDSSARFTTFRLPLGASGTADATSTVVSEYDIPGIHADEDYHYSLTMSETIRLSETVKIGETIDIKVDLVSGSHFKVMGMMLCNK